VATNRHFALLVGSAVITYLAWKSTAPVSSNLFAKRTNGERERDQRERDQRERPERERDQRERERPERGIGTKPTTTKRKEEKKAIPWAYICFLELGRHITNNRADMLFLFSLLLSLQGIFSDTITEESEYHVGRGILPLKENWP
jgi:hypothetical protein